MSSEPSGLVSVRRTCLLAGLTGIAGFLMLGESFHINNGPPLSAPDGVFLAYVTANARRVMVAAWLQAVGPALIIVFALTLVSLSMAQRRVAGLLTVFGAGVLMTVSLMEVACYIAQLYTTPPQMPRIANTFGYAIQHLYFFVAAPALFLPLGCVLLRSSVLPRIFAWLALLLGAGFVGLGILYMQALVLPAGVTAFAGVQSLWWLAAAIALMVRARRVAKAMEGPSAA